MEGQGTPSMVGISIQGLWPEGNDDLLIAREDFRDLPSKEAKEQRRAVLCVLLLAPEMLFLAPLMIPPPPIGAVDTSQGGFCPRWPHAWQQLLSRSETQHHIQVSPAPDHCN
jgi:hypothetical protein